MRILAVDYGERRVGLAVSDALEITANPLAVVEHRGSRRRAAAEVARWVAAEGVDEVVVGLPLNADGSSGPAAAAAEAFARELRSRTAVPVRTYDETLTTVAAEEFLSGGGRRRWDRRGKVDQIAAAIILEDYLRARRQQRLGAQPEDGENNGGSGR